ncbi:hypothetical protein M2132_002220 [Dysgonomonas sp. PH5-45]|uniref:hypothetical protein n=1 Tax=unclassified Dysgonomonas TaxID=2630389 RepID=UPI002474A19B|nr:MULTISPECIES: hypothetical protein [unclassified Dysgonomonas]MDH6355870.1 hypothetical protein [Dysgonomonas sp. PH5-45]MDH6388765.1 hypothetical protein [Dysgonomonas sp. PH5-37]
MKKVSFILALIICSCTEKQVVYYEYNGTTITRVDDGNKVYLFYGKQTDIDPSHKSSYIKAEYSGFNSALAGYIRFCNNGKVQVLPVAAYFEEIGTNEECESVFKKLDK